MDVSNLECGNGGPLSDAADHSYDVVRDGSSISNARLAATFSSPTSLGGLLSANALSTESLPVTSATARAEPNAEGENVVVVDYAPNSSSDDFQQSLAVPVEATPNPRGESVVVGLHARNGSTDNFEQDLAVPVEATPNPRGENVVVGLYAQNGTTDDLQEELAVPVEVIPNARGENVVAVALRAPNNTDDFQPDVAVPVEGIPPNPRSEQVAVGLHASNSSTDDFQQDAAVQVEGTPNPRDDFQQQELAVPVEGMTPTPRVENVVVGLHVNSSTGDFQQELSMPVDRTDDHKRPHEEVTKEVESRTQEQESNEGDSLFCPICMEPWTNSGEHRICALLCGHLFGKSCIRRWLRQAGKKSSRCPQCNKRAKLDDLRPLYVPRILAVVDVEAQQLVEEKVRALTAENRQLKLENEKLLQVVLQNKGNNKLVQAPAPQVLANSSATKDFINVNDPNIITGVEPLQNLRNEVTFSTLSTPSPLFLRLSSGQDSDSRNPSARSSSRQNLLHRSNEYGLVLEDGPYSTSSRLGRDDCGYSFQLQSQIDIHEGKVFDMDPESLTLIFSNKIGGNFGLSKMSLLSCKEIEQIGLPAGIGSIRDIRLSPSGMGSPGKCALIASQGKKLSLISLESNNIVLTYSLQSPPWSCAWDPYVPNLIYSGLQNGALLMLDLRRTQSPIATLDGPNIRPVHTLQAIPGQASVLANMGSKPVRGRALLSASTSGISFWNLNPSVAGNEIQDPQCVFADPQINCISLVYDSAITAAVASFRRSPSIQTPSGGQYSSQPLDGALLHRPSTAAYRSEEPFHWIFSRSDASSWSLMNERIGTTEFRLPWQRMGEMVGNKSKTLMPRSAIISPSNSALRSDSLFACGDEVTNSVWIWDMKLCTHMDTLVPHQSPVLDVKNVRIQGNDVLGCVSEKTLQIYRRLPRSE